MVVDNAKLALLDAWKIKNVNYISYLSGVINEKRFEKETMHLPAKLDKLKELIAGFEIKKEISEFRKVFMFSHDGVQDFYNSTVGNMQFFINELHHLNEFRKDLEKKAAEFRKSGKEDFAKALDREAKIIEELLKRAYDMMHTLREMATKLMNETGNLTV